MSARVHPWRVRGAAVLLLCAASTLAPSARAQTAGAAPSLAEAREYARGGDLRSALSAVDAFLAERPQDVEARLLRGVLLGRSGRSDEAIASVRALAAERPDLPEIRNNLAVLYAAQGRYEEARAALLEALRLAPDYAVAHENLGDVYAKLAALAYSSAARSDSGDGRAAGKQAAAERLVGQAAPWDDAAAPATAAAAPPARPAAVAARPAPAAPARPRPAEACVDVPMRDAEQARQVAAWLRARGLDARVAPASTDARAHRVIVPPLADLDAARREAARLEDAGITDLMLISRGEYANGISLGVYAREDGARRRVRDLAARGVNARIAPHRVRGDAAAEPRVSARGPFDPRAFALAFPDLRFEMTDCPG